MLPAVIYNRLFLHPVQNGQYYVKCFTCFRDSLYDSVQGRLHSDSDSLMFCVSWLQDRISKLVDLLQPKFAFLWEMPSKDQVKALHTQHANLPELLTGCLQQLDGQTAFEKESLGGVLRAHAKSSGMKMNIYMHLMRQVLSGLKVGRTCCGDDESGDNGDDKGGEDERLHAPDETGVEWHEGREDKLW